MKFLFGLGYGTFLCLILFAGGPPKTSTPADKRLAINKKKTIKKAPAPKKELS